jgi:hypothetical protein
VLHIISCVNLSEIDRYSTSYYAQPVAHSYRNMHKLAQIQSNPQGGILFWHNCAHSWNSRYFDTFRQNFSQNIQKYQGRVSLMYAGLSRQSRAPHRLGSAGGWFTDPLWHSVHLKNFPQLRQHWSSHAWLTSKKDFTRLQSGICINWEACGIFLPHHCPRAVECRSVAVVV